VPDRPRPIPDAVSTFYWEAADRGELAVLRCNACRRLHHPPDVGCPHCGSTVLHPEVTSGRGVVYASTAVRQAFDRAFLDAVPYVLALVALEEDERVRILGDVVDVAPEPVAIGTPVETVFERHDGWSLPRFRVIT
jgi:uncharacterized OB-fold protein